MKKVTVNELMVGCYVGMNLHDEPDNFFEVLEIGETMKVRSDISGIGFVNIDDLEAIPLSHDMMRLLGYHLLDDDFTLIGQVKVSDKEYRDVQDFVQYIKNGGYYFNRRNNKYVHELQCMCYWLNGFMPSFQKLKK